jgi:hypothetical protein
MEYVIGAVVGMVVMDLMWAFKLGIPQMIYYRWKHRNDPQPVYEGDAE